jgi:DNA invertase Pin-like site-specific DNA recombinase
MGFSAEGAHNMNDLKGLRAICYHRVSTSEQAESGAGMDAQREATAAVCKYKSWKVASVFEDNGASAKNIDRPGLTSALEMLAAGQADILVVAKLDRLSRSVLDFTGLMYKADKERWHICIKDLDLDTSHPNGRMVLHIMATLSQWEREMIGLRTKEALRTVKSKGIKIGRREMDLAVKERILEMRKKGSTLQAIADQLNKEGIPTPQGGLLWRTSSIRPVLADCPK